MTNPILRHHIPVGIHGTSYPNAPAASGRETGGELEVNERAVGDMQAAGSRTPTARAVMAALSKTFGTSVAEAVAEAVMEPSVEGARLSFDKALNAALLARSALAGVTYLSGLMHSPIDNPAGFDELAGGWGVDRSMLTPEQIVTIDAMFRRDLEVATDGGRLGVDGPQAAQIMRNAVDAVLRSRT